MKNIAKHNMINLMIKLLIVPSLVQLLLMKKRGRGERNVDIFKSIYHVPGTTGSTLYSLPSLSFTTTPQADKLKIPTL